MQDSDLLERLNAKSINNVKQVNPRVKKFLVSLINSAGKLFFLFKRNKLPANPKKILFISLYFTGDILFQSPLFEVMKKIYPDSEFHIWIKRRAKGAIDGYPYFTKVHFFDDVSTRKFEETIDNRFSLKLSFFKTLRHEKYDIIVDLTGLFWTAFAVFYAKPAYSMGLNFQGFDFVYNFSANSEYKGHLIDRYLYVVLKNKQYEEYLSKIKVKYKPEFYLDDDSNSLADKIFKSAGVTGNSFKIAIHTTAGWKGKDWEIENFKALINRLHEDTFVFLIGGPDDVQNAETILEKNTHKNIYNFTGKLSLIQSAALVKKCNLYIGADSGPLYLAEAVGTPTISLFGPTNPLFSAPRGHNHTVIYKELFCSAEADQQYCKLLAGLNCRTHDCMHLITPDDVLNTIQEIQ